jgi:hypothetical protein
MSLLLSNSSKNIPMKVQKPFWQAGNRFICKIWSIFILLYLDPNAYSKKDPALGQPNGADPCVSGSTTLLYLDSVAKYSPCIQNVKGTWQWDFFLWFLMFGSLLKLLTRYLFFFLVRLPVWGLLVWLFFCSWGWVGVDASHIFYLEVANCIGTNCIGTIGIGTNCIGTNCIGNKLYREQTVSAPFHFFTLSFYS